MRPFKKSGLAAVSEKSTLLVYTGQGPHTRRERQAEAGASPHDHGEPSRGEGGRGEAGREEEASRTAVDGLSMRKENRNECLS